MIFSSLVYKKDRFQEPIDRSNSGVIHSKSSEIDPISFRPPFRRLSGAPHRHLDKWSDPKLQ
ncbi:hypothetical protein EV356DRAFT_504773 [Viridothelium virens]|uniref:Uncharacterized protein n=1 Tax=Viridothelium virens TaxID=1048519 RepID=A0A6A6H5I7_VIRVR|nr:hypothetical protein EV356DRAFT_504773 [Viridothelium virens]